MPKLTGMITVRTALPTDLDALIALENSCFATDRMTRQSYRRFIRIPTAVVIVATWGDGLIGSLVLSCRSGSRIARIYSIAVGESHRGVGIGRQLVVAAEAAALEREHTVMVLEVRMDNRGSLALFQSLGYEKFGVLAGYYEDGEDAVRLKKCLTKLL